jgi:NitT/TauT family transport system substrate-binding protein
MFNSRKGAISGFALIAVGMTMLTGCSGQPGSGESPAEGSGSGELTPVTIGIIPGSFQAPLLTGIEAGIFEEHGLEVEVVPQTDVAAIISGVASGEYDFGFATSVHVVNANVNNIPIRAVSTVDGLQSPDEAPNDGNALVAGPDSGVTSPADLEGKTLGVVGLSSLNTMAAWALAEKEGVDPQSIELVQMPFGQMPAALAAGDIDAAVVQSPFIAEAVASGGTVIEKPNNVLFPDMAVSLYTTSQSFIDSAPEVVKNFSDAVIESQAYAAEHQDEARAALVEALSLTPEAAEAATWCTTCEPRLNTEGMDVVQELMTKYAGLTKTFPADELIWAGALKN